jgi:hypothetical protein
VDIVDKTICPNTSINYTPEDITPANAAAYNYLWRDESGRTDINLFNKYSFDANTNGKIWLEVTNKQTGCAAKDSATLTWRSQPKVDISIFSPVVGEDIQPAELSECAGNVITLNATPGFKTYSWNIAPTNATPTAQLTVPAGGQSNVVVTVSDNYDCVASDAMVLTALPLPVLDLGLIPSVMCLETKISVDNTFDRYEWEIDGINQPLLKNKNEWITTVAGTFNVKLTVWNASGCSTSATKTIKVNALPTFDLKDITICARTSTSFSGPAGMASYLWNDGSSNQNYTTSDVGKVTLIATDNNSCTFKDSAVVSWFDDPTVALSYYSTELGQTVEPIEIYACPNTSITIEATPGFSNYAWSHDANLKADRTTVNMPAVGQLSIGLTVKDKNECLTGDAVTLIAHPTPVVDMSAIPSEVCVGTTLSVANLWASYQWQIDNRPIDPLQNQNTIVASEAGTFVFKITASNDLGCSATFNKTVTVHALPVVSLDDRTVCPNTNTVYNGPAAMTAYLWADGSTANQFTASATGKVTLLVTDNNGCQNNAEATVTWFAQPVVEIAHGATQPTEVHTCPETDVTLTATPAFAQYLWGDGRNSTVHRGGAALRGLQAHYAHRDRC